jgi:hypothetical protein
MEVDARVLGEEYPDTLTSMNNVGEEHLDALTSMSNVGESTLWARTEHGDDAHGDAG